MKIKETLFYTCDDGLRIYRFADAPEALKDAYKFAEVPEEDLKRLSLPCWLGSNSRDKSECSFTPFSNPKYLEILRNSLAQQELQFYHLRDKNGKLQAGVIVFEGKTVAKLLNFESPNAWENFNCHRSLVVKLEPFLANSNWSLSTGYEGAFHQTRIALNKQDRHYWFLDQQLPDGFHLGDCSGPLWGAALQVDLPNGFRAEDSLYIRKSQAQRVGDNVFIGYEFDAAESALTEIGDNFGSQRCLATLRETHISRIGDNFKADAISFEGYLSQKVEFDGQLTLKHDDTGHHHPYPLTIGDGFRVGTAYFNHCTFKRLGDVSGFEMKIEGTTFLKDSIQGPWNLHYLYLDQATQGLDALPENSRIESLYAGPNSRVAIPASTGVKEVNLRRGKVEPDGVEITVLQGTLPDGRIIHRSLKFSPDVYNHWRVGLDQDAKMDPNIVPASQKVPCPTSREQRSDQSQYHGNLNAQVSDSYTPPKASGA